MQFSAREIQRSHWNLEDILYEYLIKSLLTTVVNASCNLTNDMFLDTVNTILHANTVYPMHGVSVPGNMISFHELLNKQVIPKGLGNWINAKKLDIEF